MVSPSRPTERPVPSRLVPANRDEGHFTILLEFVSAAQPPIPKDAFVSGVFLRVECDLQLLESSTDKASPTVEDFFGRRLHSVETETRIASNWEQKLAAAATGRLWNASKFRLHDAFLDEKADGPCRAVLQLGRTDYRDFAGTNCLLPLLSTGGGRETGGRGHSTSRRTNH